jgi:hypothetical protein
LDIPPTAWFIVAALAHFTLVLTHGVSGQRSFVSPLRRERLFPSRQWGDEDMTWRIFAVVWHMGTAAFGSCGGVLLLLAMGVLEGNSLPLFISALHATFLVLAVFIVGPRLLYVLRRPFAITVVICLTTVCVASWLGTR